MERFLKTNLIFFGLLLFGCAPAAITLQQQADEGPQLSQEDKEAAKVWLNAYKGPPNLQSCSNWIFEQGELTIKAAGISLAQLCELNVPLTARSACKPSTFFPPDQLERELNELRDEAVRICRTKYPE